MKNVHVLPTDKPSRLVKIRDILFYTTIENIIPRGVYQNIYITSDEEITGKIGFNIKENKIQFFNSHPKYDESGKKIILTTDPDLIKDGVQAIDDDFLEWFVKNPSCESVEVERLDTFKKTNEVYVDEIAGGNYYEIIKQYKIIIPQEEPEEIIYYCEQGDPYCQSPKCRCNTIKPQEEPKQDLEKDIFENLKEYYKTTPREKVLEDWNKSAEFDKVGPTVDEFIENSSEERLKEAAKEYSLKLYQDEFAWNIEDFIAGAKWQAKQMYTKEDVNPLLEAIQYFIDRVEKGTIKSKTTYNMYKNVIKEFKNK
jgi:hypothetical protein